MRPSPSSLTLPLAVLLAWVWPAGARAQIPGATDGGPPGTTSTSTTSEASEGAEFLLLPIGARAVAMGGAVTASRGSGEAVLWSPAGLAALQKGRLMFSHNESAFDTRSDVVAVLLPTHSAGTIGFTYYLVDYGQLANTDIDGQVRGTINFRNQEFLISYATRVVGPLEAGISYKLIQLIFQCQGQCPEQRSFTRSTHALDLGLIYNRLVGLPLTLGASIRHLGFPLEGQNEEDPLPTRMRIGANYQVLSNFRADSTFALAIAVDLEDRWHNPGRPDLMMGSEFGVADRLFLRAGYAFHEAGNGGPAVGVGVTSDWFYVDLSRGFDDFSSVAGKESLQVSFGLIF